MSITGKYPGSFSLREGQKGQPGILYLNGSEDSTLILGNVFPSASSNQNIPLPTVFGKLEAGFTVRLLNCCYGGINLSVSNGTGVRIFKYSFEDCQFKA